MNEKTNKIKIIKNDVEVDAEIISVFELKEFGKDYILYTFNEEQNGNVKILASTLKKEEDRYILDNIKTEEEWEKIKKFIRTSAKETQ